MGFGPGAKGAATPVQDRIQGTFVPELRYGCLCIGRNYDRAIHAAPVAVFFCTGPASIRCCMV